MGSAVARSRGYGTVALTRSASYSRLDEQTIPVRRPSVRPVTKRMMCSAGAAEGNSKATRPLLYRFVESDFEPVYKGFHLFRARLVQMQFT